MHQMSSLVEKLDRVYVCARCGMPFLFRSDAEDHREMAGRGKMCEFPL
jgi:DNA-directed RNA polymerase subunit RPC12/RpoP